MDGKRQFRGLKTLLSAAVCEWFLMFLLFADAALSYLLTKFAEYSELRPPCLLCSRLEYCFGTRKPGYYWSLLCSSHREEISTLVSCSIHGKFASADGLCKECLAPRFMQEISNSESYRLFVGKAWMDVDKSVLQNPMANNVRLGGPECRICSCCGKSWKAKTNADRLLKLNPFSSVSAKANVKPPLPRVPGRSRFSRKESSKRLRDKVSGKSLTAGSHRIDTLPRLSCGKRKISSHSDTEVLLSEDEDEGRKRSCETCSEPEYEACGARKGLQNPIVDDAVSERPTKKSFLAKPPTPGQPNLVDVSDHKNILSSSPATIIENAQRNLTWEKSYSKPSPSPELTSLDDGNRPPDIAGGSFGESSETSKSNAAHPQTPPLSGLSELMSLSHVPPLSNATMTLMKTNVDGAHEAGDVHTEAADNMHHSNTLPKSIEPTESQDKLELRIDGDSNSHAVLPDSALQMKTDSNNESTNGIDIDGEDTVDKLKHQLEIERNYINSLCKELEEERNAAGIAANQAMAMITRLQEEKAALHMEALQYLRMMEEQAEYDMEALAKANDQLAEREKELQDMEYELDFYREYVDDYGNPAGASSNSTAAKVLKMNGNSSPVNGTVSLSLVESKSYISQCLNTLEEKIHQLDDACDHPSQQKIKTEENGFLHEIDSAKLLEEIAELRERLEALETDCNFLRCASDLLRNENDGLQLLEQISQQLQELRKIEFMKR